MGFKTGMIVGAIVGGTWRLLTNEHNGEENQRRIKQYFTQASEHSKRVHHDVSDLTQALNDLQTAGIPSLTRALADIHQSVRRFNEHSQPRVRRITRAIQSLQQHTTSIDKDEKNTQKD